MEKPSKELIKKEAKKVAKIQAKANVKAKAKGAKKYGSLNEFALVQSLYMRSILDAVNAPGARIPDEITVPSYTVQVLTKFLVTTATLGQNTGAGFYRVLGNTSGAANWGFATLFASAVGGIYGAVPQTSPWAAQLIAQGASARLVSAKATMTYLGSPNNASGRFLMAFLPPNSPIQPQAGAVFNNVALNGVASGLNLLQVPNLVDVPASKIYAETRYIPLDDIARCYEVTGSGAHGTLRAPATNNSATYGGFVGIVDGTPISQSVEVNIWENYEVQPLLSLVNIAQAQTSYSDPIEMAVVSNIIAEVPTITCLQSKDQILATSLAAPGFAGASTVNMATSTKSGMTPHNKNGEPSFMSKVLSGVGTAFDIGKKALPLVAEVAALL